MICNTMITLSIKDNYPDNVAVAGKVSEFGNNGFLLNFQ